MPSSIKMIKASNVFGGDTAAKIDTQIEVEELIQNESSDTDKTISEVEIAQKKSRALLEQAEREVERLKQEATQEIEVLRKDAQEEGFNEGKEIGYQKGIEQGLTEGLRQAENQNQELKASILLMIQKAKAEVKAYQEDKREELIKLASHMAEKIVHDQIDHADEGVLLLAKPFLYQLEKDEEFVTITTHPEQRSIIEEHLHQVEVISPNTRFMVFSDPSLEEKGLVIESSKAVIDLQIKKQIDAMLQEFEEMERTVDA